VFFYAYSRYKPLCWCFTYETGITFLPSCSTAFCSILFVHLTDVLVLAANGKIWKVGWLLTKYLNKHNPVWNFRISKEEKNISWTYRDVNYKLHYLLYCANGGKLYYRYMNSGILPNLVKKTWKFENNILGTVLYSVMWITNSHNLCYAAFTIHLSSGVYVLIFLNISCLSPFGSHIGIYTVDLRPHGHLDWLLLF
jgi:hypothetical protein